MLKFNSLITLTAINLTAQADSNIQPVWELVKDSDNIQTYTIVSDKTDIVKAKARAVFDASLVDVKTVLNEVGERYLWVPYLLESSIISELNENKRIEYSLFKAPWPASNRDFVYSHEIVETSDKSIFYKMESVSLKQQAEISGVVRGEVMESSYRLKSVGNNKTEIELIYHVDPKGWLPNWIVNIIQRALPYKILFNLRNKLIEKQITK